MPEACENGVGPVNSCVYLANQNHEIYQILPYSVNFKAPGEIWNPLSKTVLNKCSIVWNKLPVNSQNDR